MTHTVITTLIDLVKLVSPNGDPDLSIPQEVASVLMQWIPNRIKVLVVQSSSAWMLVLPPKSEDDNCALGYLYQKQPDNTWEDWTLIIDPRLGCTTITGTRVENLDKLGEISAVVSDWMQQP